MTQQEAENVLGLSGGYGRTDAVSACSGKFSEWSRRNMLATSVPAKHQAMNMLRKIKEAQQVLLAGGASAPGSTVRRRRPASVGSTAGSFKRTTKRATPKPAGTAPQRRRITPSSTQKPTASPVPLARLKSRPSPRPASSARGLRNGRFPRELKVAAAALALGAFLSLMGRLSGGQGSSEDRPAVISVERGSRGKGGNRISVVPARSRARALPVTVGMSGNGEKNPMPTPAASVGFLEVQSFPVAELFLDGRSVGYAPFRVGEKVRLEEGSHRLVLKNHRFVPLSTAIEIEAGRTHEIRCWLDSGVIKVSERR